MDTLIAGNWKMNTDLTGAVGLARQVVESLPAAGNVKVAVCPPFTALNAVRNVLEGSGAFLGAQNMFYEEEGAYTGEVSASMLRSVGCRYVILGHSERRQYFGETDEGVNKKAKQAIGHDLVPIVCVGETLDQREAGKERQVVEEQVRRGTEGIDLSSADKLVIAYEPVWAIGTGRTATSEQAQEMHAFIREILQDQFGGTTASGILILYGGSMKPTNAAELLAQPDVNGGLIGGASLNAGDFISIVRSAIEVGA